MMPLNAMAGPQRQRRWAFAALLLWATTACGCSGFLHGQTGTVMSSYAREHMVPHLIADSDVGMACAMGAAMTGFVASFERVSDRPNLPVLVSYVGAGMCAEETAQQAELRGARAIRSGNGIEATDARLAGERAHRDTATRFYRAFQRAEAVWPTLGDGTCPELEADEGVFFLLGLSSGMMAVMHDRSARGTARVPTSIPVRVARATACLSDSAWWGVPSALAAAVWMTVPGSGPKDKDPIVVLDAATKTGDAVGMRLARALQIVALGGAGENAKMREAIAAHGDALKTTPAPAKWQLLDAYAMTLTRHAADLIWTKEMGYRGPTDDFSALPSKPEAPNPEDADVLDGLEE